jgi:hypothetical protein
MYVPVISTVAKKIAEKSYIIVVKHPMHENSDKVNTFT